MIENHLRDALHEVADDVPADAVPPLHLPSSRGRHNGTGHAAGRRRLFSSRWMAPAAAAAAVLAIAAGVAAVAHLSRAAPGSQVSSTPDSRAVPPYYIALTGAQSLRSDHRHLAGIYATSTGALAAAIAVPAPYGTFAAVSAAADDRTFAVAAEVYPARRLPAVTFYLVRFNPVSHMTRLTRLGMPRVPAGASFDAFALSPDASRLAVAFRRRGNAARPPSEEIRILNITTGALRTWTSSQGTVAAGTLDPWSLSWAANDATLAFNWYGFRKAGRGTVMPGTTGVRLLDTKEPGTDLVAGSKLAVRLYRGRNHATPTGLVPDVAMLTPNGKKIVAPVTTRSGTTGGFAEFSAVTGRLLRKLDWRPMGADSPGMAMDVLWTNRSGRTLVVSAPPGHPGEIGIIRGARVTILPSSGRIAFPAAAW